MYYSIAIVTTGARKFGSGGEKPPALHGEAVERFVLASPYGPNPEDGLDRTTAPSVLAAVRDGWEAARRESYHGHHTAEAFYGLVAFGSIVKGRFHRGIFKEDSDVDGVLLRRPFATNRVTYDQSHEDAVAATIQGHLQSRRINHPVNLFGMTLSVPTTLARMRVDLAISSVRKGHAPMHIRESVPCLFLLAVGSGEIPAVRNQLFDGLSELDGGDVAWRAIAQRVVVFEEHNRGGSFTLPGTVAEARDYFNHIELERQLRQGEPVAHP